MQKILFKGFCPFEIDDKIKIKATKEEGVVVDILSINSVKTGNVVFTILVQGEKGIIAKEIEEIERIMGE